MPIVIVSFIMILLFGCSKQNPNHPGGTNSQESSPSTTISTDVPVNHGADNNKTVSLPPPDIAQSNEVTATSTKENPKQSAEEWHRQFMAADDDAQQDIIRNMDSTGQDVVRMTGLMTENISPEAKQAMLEILKDGEHDQVAPAIYQALHDSDPDVVNAAVESLVALDSPADIPALQALATTSTNEDVREAATDAIDTLTQNQ